MYIEEQRPAFYRNMKYWGKKPHNVWREIIKENTEINDLVLDPFAGSGVAFFEALKIERVPIVMDLNPLSQFLFDTYSCEIDINNLKTIAKKIIDEIKCNKLYYENYIIKCTKCGKRTDIYNYKHNKNKIYEIAYKCSNCKNTIIKDVDYIFHDKVNIEDFQNLWFPDKKISEIKSISKNIEDKLNNNLLISFWTNRNMVLLAKIFNKIRNIENINIKNYLMLGFLKSVHLTSKMCIPRSSKSNRPLSTSWGRPAYMLPNKQFEQNPIVSFYKSIFGRQGVINAYESLNNYLDLPINKYNNIEKVNFNNSKIPITTLGDSKEILRKIPENVIDFIITDPPYGNIIEYIDLSYIWNVWLQKFDNKYSVIKNNSEILLENKNYESYKKDLFEIWNNCFKALKKEGKLILTFHSDSTQEWKALKSSIEETSFKYIGDYLQRNRRSSESNVGAKSGKAISDHYIMLQK